MRQFAIIGLGSFGSTVALELASRGLSVLAIDKNPSRVDEIRNSVTHAALGDATDPAFLGSMGVSEVDVVLVALGDDIEASVLVTLNLSEIGIKYIVVKGISREHGSILEAVGAHKVVFPEREMAEKLAMSLASPNIIDHIPLVEGYIIVEMVAPAPFRNRSLIDLNLRREYGVELLAIKRADPTAEPPVIVVPGAGAIIRPNDKLVIMGAVDKVELLREL